MAEGPPIDEDSAAVTDGAGARTPSLIDAILPLVALAGLIGGSLAQGSVASVTSAIFILLAVGASRSAAPWLRTRPAT